ncbi:DUF5133 domain-containing protein [Streptomyces sp. NPDC086989]|uniref:DUF5133 domain-containing protein n=1 Tax=Streptomyces sp. NPDC086989 TaxID=3365764 RepID=UPI0037F42837
MLMAHPAVLARLVEEYETVARLRAGERRDAVRQRLEDVVYTLCVSTGTRDIDAALVSARERMSAARPGAEADGVHAEGLHVGAVRADGVDAEGAPTAA